ncbi:hypothetical protein Salat_1140900 [Sesamum alatum]|uniref:Uncharacterized protein n=1 Tax=Sesamum alatum TaxID=300844 RepID=A0AAE1YF13_9LAMI|nr:hypothetical protein Salat_1140900 [Sesamum alatum]
MQRRQSSRRGSAIFEGFSTPESRYHACGFLRVVQAARGGERCCRPAQSQGNGAMVCLGSRDPIHSSLSRLLPGHMKVASLILHGDWNMEMIRVEFESIDAGCILSTLLPANTAQDEAIWHFKKSGNFSVQSACTGMSSSTGGLWIGVSFGSEGPA